MVLHLILSQQMDNLLCYLISEKDISAGADLVKIFHATKPETSPVDSMTDMELIEVFNWKMTKKSIILFYSSTLIDFIWFILELYQ